MMPLSHYQIFLYTFKANFLRKHSTYMSNIYSDLMQLEIDQSNIFPPHGPDLDFLLSSNTAIYSFSMIALKSSPICITGMWERMCGRTQSRVLPLHLGVMQKRFETVRVLLDFGADPNMSGSE